MTQLELMNVVRSETIRSLLKTHGHLFAGKDLLEIGSGTGAQLLLLREVCRSAVGIEIGNAWYGEINLAGIIPYDGQRIPFSDQSFDVIFSSNVMEHIAAEKAIHAEMHRVLRPGGVCFHIVPSATWRILASLAHYPALIKRILQKLSGRTTSDDPGPNSNSGPVTIERWKARLKFAPDTTSPWRVRQLVYGTPL